MKPIMSELEQYQREVADAMSRLDITADQQKLADLEQQMQQPDFWNDSTEAERISRQAAELRRSVEQWQSLSSDLKSMIELVRDSKNDLFTPFPHGQGQTLLREAILVIDHNSYHVGQVVDLRRLLGIAG